MQDIRKVIFSKNLFFCVLIANIIINSASAAANNTLNSDFVAGLILTPYIFKSKIYLPPDTYFLHYPLFYITLKLFGYTFITAILNMFLPVLATLGSFSIFYLYFVQKYLPGRKIIYFLPLLLFINSSWLFYNIIAQPLGRNIEFGLILLITIYFDNLKSLSKNIVLSISVYSLLLLILISDPYFYYLFTLPLLIILAMRIVKGMYYLKATFLLLATMGIDTLTRSFLNTTPFFLIYNYVYPHTVKEGTFANNLFSTISGIFNLLNLQYLPKILFILTLGLFFIAIFGLFKLFKTYLKDVRVIPTLAVICFGVTILAHLFSDMASNTNSRYLISILFFTPLGLSFYLSQVSSSIFRSGVISSLLLISLTNFVLINTTFFKTGHEQPYLQNDLIIKTVSQDSLDYGFTGYWNANINTFLSKNTIKFNPVLCVKGHIYPYNWASSESWYSKTSHIGRTFLLTDLENKLTPDLSSCNKSDIVSQFGNPTKIVPIFTDKGSFSLSIFDYNIAEKF